MIIVHRVEVVGCIRLCNRLSNLRGVAERSNVSLVFSPSSSPSSSSSFFSRLEANAASLSRDCLFIARTSELSTICRSDLIIGLKCLQHHVLFDSTDLQSAMFLADRLALFLDLARDFFMLAHISHVHLWRSIGND